MVVRWSRIHAELGLTPTELTHEMIVRAVESAVQETDDLDWKQALPVDVDKKLKEFAKDVAAMANTNGGVIVYGVREDDQRAAEITPVPVTTRERERLRALAARHIRPLIAGVEIVPLVTEEDDERGVLVVSVPASPDAPHVVGERNEMGIPFRHGPHTEWMSEHQLERAYRDRFNRQADDAEALTRLRGDLTYGLDFSAGAWLLLAGRPLNPLSTGFHRPDPDHITEVLKDALRVGLEIYPSSNERVHVLQGLGREAVNNPRIGLRRWVIRSNHATPGAATDLIHIELHHDGAAMLAVAVGRWAGEGSGTEFHPVPTRAVQSAIAEGVAVATTNARRRGHTGPMRIQATLTALAGDLIAPVDNHVGGGMFVRSMEIVHGARAIKQVTPVETEVLTDGEPTRLRAGTRQLCEDLLHQFGVTHISVPE